MSLTSKSIHGTNSSILKAFEPKLSIFTKPKHPSYSRILDIILRVCCKVNSSTFQFFVNFFPTNICEDLKLFTILTKHFEIKELFKLNLISALKKSKIAVFVFFPFQSVKFSIFDHELYQQLSKTANVCVFVNTNSSSNFYNRRLLIRISSKE